MRFALILLDLLVRLNLATADEVIPSVLSSHQEPYIPVNVQSATAIVIDDARYKLHNISLSKNSTPDQVLATAVEWPARASLLHPAFWSYFIHFAGQAATTIGVLVCVRPSKNPSRPEPVRVGAIITTVILVLAVLCWPISWATGQPIGQQVPLSADWWFMVLKSFLVNIAPTVPMMLCLILNPSARTRQYVSFWFYFVLWLNVAWTLLALGDPAQVNAVSLANGACGGSLMLSLIIHNVALVKKGLTPARGRALCEVKGDILLGYGTSLSWLVCYTAWNATFVFTTLVVSVTLQDIFFWAMMVFFYYWSDAASPIENYFCMARPLSLSTYIGVTDWIGFLDYFRNGPPYKLDLTRHAFFLFIAVANAVYSIYVLYWECCLLFGWGGAAKYFSSVLNIKDDDEIYGEMDEDPEEYESEEEE